MDYLLAESQVLVMIKEGRLHGDAPRAVLASNIPIRLKIHQLGKDFILALYPPFRGICRGCSV